MLSRRSRRFGPSWQHNRPHGDDPGERAAQLASGSSEALMIALLHSLGTPEPPPPSAGERLSTIL